MFGSRAGRVWRGVVAGFAATFFATVSHSLADGTVPPLLPVILALTAAVPVSVALAGRRLSWLRLSAAIGVSQFAFHGLLLLGVGAGGSSAVGSVPGHAHAADVLAVLPPPGATHPSTHGGVWMWCAHAIAAIATILVLGHGERALRALLDLLQWRFLARALTWHPAPWPARLPAVVARLLTATAALFLSDARRRGPPIPA